MPDQHENEQRAVREMAAKLRAANPALFGGPNIAPPARPASTPSQPARDEMPVEPTPLNSSTEPDEPLPSPRSLGSIMWSRAFEVQLQREAEEGRAQRAADYGPIEAMEARIQAGSLKATTREVLDEGIAVIRGEVDAGCEEGDRKRVDDGLAYLTEIDEFLSDYAAGKFPDL